MKIYFYLSIAVAATLMGCNREDVSSVNGGTLETNSAVTAVAETSSVEKKSNNLEHVDAQMKSSIETLLEGIKNKLSNEDLKDVVKNNAPHLKKLLRAEVVDGILNDTYVLDAKFNHDRKKVILLVSHKETGDFFKAYQFPMK